MSFAIALFQFDSILGGAGDLGFALSIMAWVYVLYWLLQLFADNQALFFGAAILASYLALVFTLPFMLLAVVLLVVNPMFLQNIIFGPVMSIQQLGGLHDTMRQEANQRQMAVAQERAAAGETLSPEEQEWFNQAQQGQGQGGQMQPMRPNPLMMRR